MSENTAAGKTSKPRTPKPGQSLADLHPEIAGLWHPTLNGELSPADVTARSRVTAWWVCGKHEPYQRAVAGSVVFGGRCPECSRAQRMAPKEGQSLADLFPDIAAEWHPELNGDVTPEDLKPASNQKRWWLCQEHGAYEMTTSRRTSRDRSRCPKCPRRARGSVPKTERKVFRSLAEHSPELAGQWHPELNGEKTPENITYSSTYPAYWRCDSHGPFQAKVTARTLSGAGCTACARERIGEARRRPAPGRSLADLHPALAAEWDYELNKAHTPSDLRPFSKHEAWWTCELHGSYRMKVTARTQGTAGCTGCGANAAARGNGRMTRKRLIALLESFRDGLASNALTQAQIMTLGIQAGIAKNSAFQRVVNGHSVKDLEEAIRALNGGVDDLVDLDDAAEAPLASETGQGASGGSTPAVDAGSGTAPGLHVIEGERSDDQAADGQRPVLALVRNEDELLPSPSAAAILRNSGPLMAAADEEALKFLIASQIDLLWKAAYHDAGQTDADTAKARENLFEEQVRAAFRREFDQACALVPPAGWSFEPYPGSGIKPPLLMQAHVATQLAEKRRIGNWSGTGAGKTVSAVLGARIIGAGYGDGVVLVVCPNNTVDGWRETILNCYPDSRIATGRLDPVWAEGTGPRWMVINFDALSQPNSAAKLAKLFEREDLRLDLVVTDEVHLAKHRGANNDGITSAESNRRANLKTVLLRGAEENPGMAVLGMSATPLINDLNEGRSVLELILGVEYADLDTYANTQNCLKMHQQFVLAGTRFMPEYDAELELVQTEVGCDDLVDGIRALGRQPHPASVERVLLEAKLPVIVDECLKASARGKKSFVYSHYVDGFIDLIRDELEAAGLSVGIFTGGEKDGLARFTGRNSDGTQVPDSERVDVLIGSSAISTGVDGLQHVTDTLIFAVLPWTAAEREQVIGRIHRTGQRSEKVRVVTPMTVAYGHVFEDHEGNETAWSWCRRRLGILTFKQSVADAVLDGVIAKSLAVSPQKASDAILEWIFRLENEGQYVVQRRSLQLAA